MNRCYVQIAKSNQAPTLASPRLQRTANSTGPRFLLITIIVRMLVTFLLWRTYFVVKFTPNGESAPAAQRLMEKKSKRNIVRKQKNDE